MKKIFLATLLLVGSVVSAAETITVLNPQGPTHSGTPQLLAVVNEANRIQNKFRFVIEFKPGAFESIALREINESPNNKIATITNAAVEGFDRGLANDKELIPVFSQGDSCWALIGIADVNMGLDSFKSVKEIIVGGPAIGGATHLAALEIGQRYKKPVRYIVYKSNFDAFINMVSDGSINFIFERIRNYENFKDKNPKMHILSMSCPTRHPAVPNVKILKEYGINTPYIWQHIVANKNMSLSKIEELRDIFYTATRNIGLKNIQELSDQTPATFQNISSVEHYRRSLSTIREYREKFRKEIEAAR